MSEEDKCYCEFVNSDNGCGYCQGKDSPKTRECYCEFVNGYCEVCEPKTKDK